jgi:hypothetical protein
MMPAGRPEQPDVVDQGRMPGRRGVREDKLELGDRRRTTHSRLRRAPVTVEPEERRLIEVGKDVGEHLRAVPVQDPDLLVRGEARGSQLVEARLELDRDEAVEVVPEPVVVSPS